MRTYRYYLLDTQGHIAGAAKVIKSFEDGEAEKPLKRHRSREARLSLKEELRAA